MVLKVMVLKVSTKIRHRGLSISKVLSAAPLRTKCTWALTFQNYHLGHSDTMDKREGRRAHPQKPAAQQPQRRSGSTGAVAAFGFSLADFPAPARLSERRGPHYEVTHAAVAGRAAAGGGAEQDRERQGNSARQTAASGLGNAHHSLGTWHGDRVPRAASGGCACPSAPPGEGEREGEGERTGTWGMRISLLQPCVSQVLDVALKRCAPSD